MSRLNLSQRTAIECGIYQRLSMKEIALRTGISATSVSAEIKRNRTLVTGDRPNGHDCMYAGECKTRSLCGNKECQKRCVFCKEYDCTQICGRYINKPCPKLSNPPFVCNICERRRKCRCDRAYYSASQADAVSKRRNSQSRSKFHVRGQDLEKLDNIVTPLIRKGQPLSHIWAEHGEEIGISQRTLYRYIDSGLMCVSNIDLRRKVKYKPRKKKKEQSDSFLNQEFRKSRTYIDYLKYMEKHPDTSVVQMDTVKGIREQGKRMLTLHFLNTNLMLIFLMRDGRAQTVVEQFDYLTSILGVDDFRKLFPLILTDNGAEFKYTRELENTDDGKKRTRLFYCDPQASYQKPHIEKNHEFIRYVLPKGKSFNPYTNEDMTILMNNINSIRRDSLGGKSPYEAVCTKELNRLMNLMGLHQLDSDEVNLTPKLLKK